MVSSRSQEESAVPMTDGRPRGLRRRTFLAGIGGMVGAGAATSRPAAADTQAGYGMGYTQGYR